MALLTEHGVSQRELARRTQQRDGWGGSTAISKMALGELRPSMRAMDSIARALGVRPEVFAEYRLAVARQRLDPEVVGLERALQNLGE